MLNVKLPLIEKGLFSKADKSWKVVLFKTLSNLLYILSIDLTNILSGLDFIIDIPIKGVKYKLYCVDEISGYDSFSNCGEKKIYICYSDKSDFELFKIIIVQKRTVKHKNILQSRFICNGFAG